MHVTVPRQKEFRPAFILQSMLMAVLCILLSGTLGVYAQSWDFEPKALSADIDQALVILSNKNINRYSKLIALVDERGGEVLEQFPPNAFITTLNPYVEWTLNNSPTVKLVERNAIDPDTLANFGGQATGAAYTWNTNYLGIPDPHAPVESRSLLSPLPYFNKPDVHVPPNSFELNLLSPKREDRQLRGEPASVLAAPTATQTSEFMAGSIVYSVVFLESNGKKGFCGAGDPQSEDWDTPRKNNVLSKISNALNNFWKYNALNNGVPSILNFVRDDRGSQPTSCEPIAHPSTYEGMWIADALTAMGFPASPTRPDPTRPISPTNPDYYFDAARKFAHSRRTALKADWAFIIFVVDSYNDPDGRFAAGRDENAYAHFNGPFMVMTYDNGDWGFDSMARVVAHETGHIFGASDEAVANCSITETSGYLNVANASCNNGGITNDTSIMGEPQEIRDKKVGISVSARDAIGWRKSPGNVVIDVVSTATVSITATPPHPTDDSTPTYSAIAGNKPFPNGGCNIVRGEQRCHQDVSISKVKGTKMSVKKVTSVGPPYFTSNSSMKATDGAYDEPEEDYTFTWSAYVVPGTYIFGTLSENNFGHISAPAYDMLTVIKK